MAALTGPRLAREQTIKSKNLVLAGSTAVYRGGMACVDTSAHVCTKGKASTTLIPVGLFEQDVDNSGSTGTSFALVTLSKEILCQWFDNDTGANAIATADLYGNCYTLDDHTVTKASSGNSVAGRIWDVDATRGVLVQMNQF